jgi:hypothetical protein
MRIPAIALLIRAFLLHFKHADQFVPLFSTHICDEDEHYRVYNEGYFITAEEVLLMTQHNWMASVANKLGKEINLDQHDDIFESASEEGAEYLGDGVERIHH